MEESVLPCADKMTFDTKKEAIASMLTAQWQHGTKLKPYKCKYCGLWHLSSDFS